VAHESHSEKRGLVTGSPSFVTGRLFTVAEVAEVMRVSNMTVYRLIRSGELPALRVGKGYRIFESDLERFLEGRSVHVEGG
jgi:excisionase family DNA binding protein